MFPITLKLTHKILLFVFLTIVVVASAISFRVSVYINNWLDSEVLNKQNKSILVAGSILHRDLPTFEMEKKRDGSFKFIFSELPVFEEHDIIDDVGFITQETATVFLWDEETKDFWRKTTNIKKDDGSRAVGTPLGKKGKVYPYMVKGENFLGTATILGKDYYTRYDPIYKKGTKDIVGILYVGMEKAHFDKVRNDLLHNILLVSCVVAFIMLVISMLVLRRILSKKIALVVSQMHRLSNGDKEFDVIGMDLRDEIGDMNKAIEVFRQNALEIDRMHEQQVINDQRNEEEKRNSLGKIADSFDERVGGLIVNLSESAGILTETAETMRGVADNTSQSSLKVVTASSEVSSNVNTVAAAIEEMSATSNEISSQMLSVKNKSDDTARNAKLANDTVSNLDQLAQNIGEVVVSIQDIAEQTNLLALNATIEAARAGEAGKGFAVVADEVKKLATETAQKTEEISSRITQIQGATSNSVAAMSKIISSVDDIDQAITAVSAAVEEQNVTTNEIVRSVSEASHAVEGVSSSIQDVQNDASLTGESSDNVLNAAQKVSVLSDELRESVDSFVAQIRS